MAKRCEWCGWPLPWWSWWRRLTRMCESCAMRIPYGGGPTPRRLAVALAAVVMLVLVPALPAQAGTTCAVTPDPVVWAPDATYTVTAQLRSYGWYSIRVDRVGGDTFGHHSESSPWQLGADGWLEAVFHVVNGPRDSVYPGDQLSIHIRARNGTGGGGAHCDTTVVAG